MKLAVLVSFATASAFLSFDAQAEVNRNCTTTLEAQPVNAPQKPGTDAKKACPVAVTYTRRSRPTLGAEARDATRTLSDSGVRA